MCLHLLSLSSVGLPVGPEAFPGALTHVYACMYVCINKNIYNIYNINIAACVYIYMYIHIYICLSLYKYIYIHT